MLLFSEKGYSPFYSGTSKVFFLFSFLGFGLTAPATFEGQLFFLFYAMIGIPLNILFLNTALERIVTALSSFVRIGYNYIPKNKILTKPGPKEFPLVEVIIVAVVIFSIISFLIAIAFTFIEGWTFFESIYFIIVACSTVGFGDYVPSKTKSIAGTNHHDAYRVFNWFLICIGVVFIYVVLNLCANLFKNILRLCIEKSRKYVCPFINTRVEPADSKNASRRSAVNGRSGRISRASVDTEGGGLDIGSFAAIQSALDRLKLQAGEGSGATELKALSSIEDLLKKEYKRVQQRQGNTAKARWKRAAARVRSLSTSKPGILSPVMSSSINGSQISSTQKMGNGTSSSINGSQIWTTHELRNSTSRLPATHDEENIPGAVN